MSKSLVATNQDHSAKLNDPVESTEVRQVSNMPEVKMI